MRNGLVVRRFINHPVKSNCYVLHYKGDSEAIIIDPGSQNIDELKKYIDINCLRIEFVIITHEHFDHIWGVNILRDHYKFKLIASEYCSDSIQHSKRNLSLYFDQKGFICKAAEITFDKDEYEVLWSSSRIKLIRTPGHSEGSICILIGDSLFTGDTIIKDEETITKLPGGSKEKLRQSLYKLHLIKGDITTIYPGHNESFSAEEFTIK